MGCPTGRARCDCKPQPYDPMPSLVAKFVKPEKTIKGERTVRLKVILTNTSGHDLSVLTWNTPLDGVITDCLNVSVDGKKVAYDGPIIKRAAPTAKDYIVIKAGQSVEGEFAVSDAYDTSKPGSYKVKLKASIADARPKKGKKAAALKAADSAPAAQPIKGQTEFTVGQATVSRPTLGALARAGEKKESGKRRSPDAGRGRRHCCQEGGIAEGAH